jgi:hypothetical protein
MLWTSEKAAMRAFIAGGIAIILSFTLQFAPSAAIAQTPLVPIISFLRHWDHHWYIWLPGDPVYEAVEIMAAERGPGAGPLVWVFFTERDGPKHQVHYFNDVRVAAARDADYRDIAFTMGGVDGGPREVSVRLVDRDGRPVAIAVGFEPDGKLVTKGAGLTNQIGHSGDRLLLVFFREKNAFAKAWHVTIAGTDVAVPQPGQNHPAPLPAAYSANIFVAGFPFGNEGADFGDGGSGGEGNKVRFAAAKEAGAWLAPLPDASRIELAAQPDGALAYYRHRNANHLLEIGFDPPLPSAGRFDADANSAFSLSLDGFGDLMAGMVHASRRGDTIVLDWRFEKPEWARARQLRSKIFVDDGSVARVELRPVAEER